MAGNPVSLIPRDYIRLTVRDQGTGIASDNLIKIFDPYFTTPKSGSGLGLSVAHCIIEKHEGRITASSTPGEETCFTLYLPSSTDQHPTLPDVDARVEAGMGHVLVMGDETYIRELTAVMLKRLGYSASLAADGGEAVRLYESSMDSETPVDAVILDLTVPAEWGALRPSPACRPSIPMSNRLSRAATATTL
jgi:hypothetical protein